MSDTILKPRPATIPFGKDEGSSEYPAKVIEKPFDQAYGEPTIDNAYKNAQGDILFEAGNNWYVLGKDGKEAYKIKLTGGAIRSENRAEGNVITKCTITFSTDAQGKNESTLKVDGNNGRAYFDDKPLTTLSANEKKALLEHTNKEITFIGVPDVRMIEQALELPDGNKLIISASGTDYSYDSIRVFKGKDLNQLEEIPVSDVKRLRDGGTTYYNTAEGTIFVPTHFSPADPTWTPANSYETEEATKLKKLNVEDISKRIGTSDKRIIGIQTWEEYSEEALDKGTTQQIDLSALNAAIKEFLDKGQDGKSANDREVLENLRNAAGITTGGIGYTNADKADQAIEGSHAFLTDKEYSETAKKIAEIADSNLSRDDKARKIGETLRNTLLTYDTEKADNIAAPTEVRGAAIQAKIDGVRI